MEEGALAAAGDGEVFRPDLPAEFAPEQRGEGAAETGVALGRIIMEQQALKGIAVGQYFVHALAHERRERGHGGRIAAAEHAHFRVGGQGAAHVIHELQNTAATGEFGSDLGEFKSTHGGGHSGLASSISISFRRAVWKEAGGGAMMKMINVPVRVM
jgi:hypothetical protein